MPLSDSLPDYIRLLLWLFNAAGLLLVTVVGFLIVRTLNGLDRTIEGAGRRIDEAAARIQGHETRLSRLEGFHQGFQEGKRFRIAEERDGND